MASMIAKLPSKRMAERESTKQRAAPRAKPREIMAKKIDG
jgi:hypothetical protein